MFYSATQAQWLCVAVVRIQQSGGASASWWRPCSTSACRRSALSSAGWESLLQHPSSRTKCTTTTLSISPINTQPYLLSLSHGELNTMCARVASRSAFSLVACLLLSFYSLRDFQHIGVMGLHKWTIFRCWWFQKVPFSVAITPTAHGLCGATYNICVREGEFA